MKLLIIGNSHADIFRGRGEKLEILTTERMYHRATNSGLDEWLQARVEPGTRILLCTNEVDIRGHYWRHYPRRPHVPLAEFVQVRVEWLHNFSQYLADAHSGIERVVFWAPPPATANTNHNIHWPFVGSVPTRNRIIHEFNRQFAQRVTQQVGMATGFYEHIDPATYMPVDHMPTDGVHYDQSLADGFWTRLIEPALAGDNSVKNNPTMQSMSATFRMVAQDTTRSKLYDSWIRTRDLTSPAGFEHTTQYMGEHYSFVTIRDHEHRFPDEYTELVLA
jgi:hypothetical protein